MKKWIVAVGVLFSLASSISFATEPIRLGFVYIFSGRAALHGQVAKQGVEVALQEINREGGINGRKVEAFFEDSKAKPEIGAEAAKKLVTQDKVDAVIGIISSAVAPAVSAAMNELKTHYYRGKSCGHGSEMQPIHVSRDVQQPTVAESYGAPCGACQSQEMDYHWSRLCSGTRFLESVQEILA